MAAKIGAKIAEALAAGEGIRKVGRSAGVGASVVQRVRAGQ